MATGEAFPVTMASRSLRAGRRRVAAASFPSSPLPRRHVRGSHASRVRAQRNGRRPRRRRGTGPHRTVRAKNPEKADTSKILNYNPDMEYRRCGKTNLMVSAVCLGGHWKRMDAVVPKVFTGRELAGRRSGKPRLQEEPPRRCVPLHRSGHQLRRCLHAPGVPGLRQGAEGPPRQDVPGLSPSPRPRSAIPAAAPPRSSRKRSTRACKEAGLEYVDLWRITCLEQSSQHDRGRPSRTSSKPWTGRRRAAGPASPASPRTTARTSRS